MRFSKISECDETTFKSQKIRSCVNRWVNKRFFFASSKKTIFNSSTFVAAITSGKSYKKSLTRSNELWVKNWDLACCVIEWHYTECCYSKCPYADSCYAECRFAAKSHFHLEIYFFKFQVEVVHARSNKPLITLQEVRNDFAFCIFTVDKKKYKKFTLHFIAKIVVALGLGADVA